jgi:iron complex transport system substrate-binding protein
MRWIIFLMCCVAMACTQAREHTFPQRIVSLLPSLTESVCALGACDRLVGVDRYSNWPAQVKKLPQMGGGLDVNIEAVVKARPDLVLLASSSRAGARLQELGIRVMALEPASHDEAHAALIALDEALGTKQAAAVWARVVQGLAAASKEVPASYRGARFYFEVDRTPYAAGQASFMGQTLAALGLKNIVGKELGAFPKINPEYVVQQQPQLIFLSQRHANELPRRPGWAALDALKKQQVCEFTPEEGDLLVRSGPRLHEGARVVTRCLQRLEKLAR